MDYIVAERRSAVKGRDWIGVFDSG